MRICVQHYTLWSDVWFLCKSNFLLSFFLCLSFSSQFFGLFSGLLHFTRAAKKNYLTAVDFTHNFLNLTEHEMRVRANETVRERMQLDDFFLCRKFLYVWTSYLKCQCIFGNFLCMCCASTVVFIHSFKSCSLSFYMWTFVPCIDMCGSSIESNIHVKQRPKKKRERASSFWYFRNGCTDRWYCCCCFILFVSFTATVCCALENSIAYFQWLQQIACMYVSACVCVCVRRYNKYLLN